MSDQFKAAASILATMAAAVVFIAGFAVSVFPAESLPNDRPDSKSPVFTEPPTVAANTNPSVPLAAIVRFAAPEAVATTIEISDGERSWHTSFDSSRDPKEGLPVLGLRPKRSHTLRVSIRDADGNESHHPELLEFTTPPLPADPEEFPPIRTTVSEPERMEPGITLLSVRRNVLRKKKFNEGYGLLLALDADGEVVWYYRTDARISDVERLRSGNLVYLTHDHRAVEIDMLGNVVAQWYAAKRPQGPTGAVPVDTLTFHHEIDELPSGNLLVLGTQLREIDGYYTSDTDPEAPRKTQQVMGDEIVEFRRDGEVVWRWNAYDYLDPFFIGHQTLSNYWPLRGFPDALDWTHANGLFYDHRDDSILLNLRKQSAILSLDRSSGEIRWILSEPTGWSETLQRRLLEPEGDIGWPWYQHAPSLTPAGTLLLFNNGIWKGRPFKAPAPPSESHTRAIEYAIDPDRGTVREVWSSEEPGPDAIVTWAMGDADWLQQTGNVLVFYGNCTERNDEITSFQAVLERSWTRVREYTHTKPPELVFEVILRDEVKEDGVIAWMIFGGLRFPSLLP